MRTRYALFCGVGKGHSPFWRCCRCRDLKHPSSTPQKAQRLDVEGFVLLGFDLAEDEIQDLRVIESQPRLVFDKSAMKFVGGFKFAMPEEDGNTVPVKNITFKVRFRLQ